MSRVNFCEYCGGYGTVLVDVSTTKNDSVINEIACEKCCGSGFLTDSERFSCVRIVSVNNGALSLAAAMAAMDSFLTTYRGKKYGS